MIFRLLIIMGTALLNINAYAQMSYGIHIDNLSIDLTLFEDKSYILEGEDVCACEMIKLLFSTGSYKDSLNFVVLEDKVFGFKHVFEESESKLTTKKGFRFLVNRSLKLLDSSVSYPNIFDDLSAGPGLRQTHSGTDSCIQKGKYVHVQKGYKTSSHYKLFILENHKYTYKVNTFLLSKGDGYAMESISILKMTFFRAMNSAPV